MEIAYFINQYPKVSHSFIRREIQALEAMEFTVHRFALRTDPAELVDNADQSEYRKTRYLLSASPIAFVVSLISCFINNPGSFFHALIKAIKLGLRSERGVLRHIIYFVEACLLTHWLKNTNTQHIHAHFGTNSAMVVMLAHLLGAPGYSFTVHGPEEFDKPEFIHLGEKIQHSRFVVAISSYGRSQLFRWIPAEQWPKVNIVHCGLDAAFLAAKPERIPNTSQQLVCVGRLCEQKGQLLLLDAFRQLRDDGINCNLVLAGDGPMRAEIESRIANYRLEKAVQITGWVSGDQVKALLIKSRGMVLPSFAEGLPVVIMEALALRRPVISTYVAGIPELIQSGKNGWLVPPGDVASLKSAMRALLKSSAADLETMGQQGYDAVTAQHDVKKETRILAELFKKVSA
ncbi:colanic acid/amylovoran biosynthesis glycosyltransferase [biofilm metagenome]